MMTSPKRMTIFALLILLTVIFCVSCAPNTDLKYDTIPNVDAENDSSCYTGYEGVFQFTIIAEEVRIDYVNPCNGNITVPEKIQNFVVTEIGTSAFYQNDCAAVDLPSTIRSIQSAAFYRCSNMKDITIPSETVLIDGNPFFRCSELEYIHVQPGNAKYCDINGVLYNSTGSTLIAYPEGRSETVYEVPDGVTQIADEAFGYDARLERVVIPESVVVFPEYNLFETYEHISFVVVPGSDAEEYASKYGIPVKYV